MICMNNERVTQQLYLASEKLTIGRQSHVCTWRAFSQLSRSLGRERLAHMRTTRGSKCHDVSPLRNTHTSSRWFRRPGTALSSWPPLFCSTFSHVDPSWDREVI
mmetsp:Transcript_16154/g.23945  ORF Transcript_16154/g.23945 Transcript_16154/m.23945 type:complete len:104 (-) Transcript_16154:1702-2013(-)